METDRAKEIIIEILQKSLIGKLDSSTNFRPQDVADAIASKVDFGKTYIELKNDKVVSVLREGILAKKKEMLEESEKANSPMLKNFIFGKITSYDEILETLKNIK